MSGTMRKNLLMFHKLCGEDALKDVVLVTTKWGKIEEVVGDQREKELKEMYWKTMIDHRSNIRRYKGSSDSAWEILKELVPQTNGTSDIIKIMTPTQTDVILYIPRFRSGIRKLT
jgi:hypothetical protein